MNFTYQIRNGKIYEYPLYYVWYIEQLNKYYDSYNLNYKNSFNRTKEWVIKNHPELLI